MTRHGLDSSVNGIDAGQSGEVEYGYDDNDEQQGQVTWEEEPGDPMMFVASDLQAVKIMAVMNRNTSTMEWKWKAAKKTITTTFRQHLIVTFAEPLSHKVTNLY